MKFAKSTFLKLVFVAFAVGEVAFVMSIQSQTPTPTPEGRVTQIFHDVQLLPAQAEARAAAIDDKVDEDTGLRTGDDSRSELTFADLTITRLGANTVFSFNKAGRSVRLDGGSILLYVRKNSGGAEISTKAVSVGITGTTLIFESQPLSHDRLIVLEGRARFTLNNYPDQTTEIGRGQLLNVQAGAKKLPRPGRVELGRIVNTHPLIKNFPPLPSLDLILGSTQNRNVAASPPQPPPAGPTGGSTGYVPHPTRTPPIGAGGRTYGGPNQPPPVATATPRHRITPRPRPTIKPTPKPTPKPPVTTGTPTTIRKYPVRKKSTPTPTPVQIR